MKPAPFEYFDPESVDEAVAILGRHDGEAKVLAGGQSLVPLLNMRLSRPRAVVDLRRVPGLDRIREEDGQLVVGAMTRQRGAESSEAVRARCPLLAEAIGFIGHTPIRTRGTIGGSIAHADPAAELPAVLLALGGSVRSVGPAGERILGAEELFLSYLTTALGPADVVTEVRFPMLAAGSGTSFMEVARRHGDFALVGVAAAVTLGADGSCAAARLGLTGVGATPHRPRQAEEMLRGAPLDREAIAAAAQSVAASVDPDSDIHASADFRRHLARVLTARALEATRQRAQGGSR